MTGEIFMEIDLYESSEYEATREGSPSSSLLAEQSFHN